MVAPPTSFVIWVQPVRARTPRRVPTVRGTGRRGFLGDRGALTVGTTGRWHGGNDQRVRFLTLPAPPTRTMFVRRATGRALAPAPSSSDSLSSLGQRTHRRAHAATSKLSTSDSGTSLHACLVKDTSTCGQCMLVTSAQGADQDLLSIAAAIETGKTKRIRTRSTAQASACMMPLEVILRCSCS
jgi:hypothetical protein